MVFRITTWNVNGIRNPFSYQPWRDKKSFSAMFDILEADIVVLQETKIQRKDLRDDMVMVPGWDCYFSLPRFEKGKFGVAIYTRQSKCAPIRAEEGISGTLCGSNSSTKHRDLPSAEQIGGYPTPKEAKNALDVSQFAKDPEKALDIAGDFDILDSEGRCMILEFPAFVLVGVYCPANRDESRAAFRAGFLNLLDLRVRKLVSLGKRVVLAGDLNIIKSESDMANAATDLRKQGLTPEEYFSTSSRRLLNHLLEDGSRYGTDDEQTNKPILFDVCRAFNPGRKGMFTCWETRINARPGNYGARIDYVLCSLTMRSWFSYSNIQEGLMGSDHCPVYAELNDVVSMGNRMMHLSDMMNPIEMFSEGNRLREYASSDMLPASGKLLPEFNGRRSIREMFGKKPSASIERPSNLKLDGDQASMEFTSDLVATATEYLGVPKLPASNSPTHQDLSSQESVKFARGTKRDAPSKSRPNTIKRSRTAVPKVRGASNQKGQQTLKGFLHPTGIVGKRIIVDNATQPTPSFVDEAQKDIRPTGHEDSYGEIAPRASDTVADDHQKPAMHSASNNISVDVIEPFSGDSKIDTLDEESDTALQDLILRTERSAQDWSKLFKKPEAPLCEGHDEPCKSMITKKAGPNCGRSFWICAKPLGPSGKKENGTQWRCGTFIWCTERHGSER